MANLNLNPDPVFKCPVPIPVPGHDPVEVVFHFKHKSRPELKKFLDNTKKMQDIDALLEICCGWDDVDQDFGKESLTLLTDNFHGSAIAIFETYAKELRGARVKN